MPNILAIETSCDETAASVVGRKDGAVTVLSSVVSSQVELHAHYGGVVPNLAAREHVRNIIPVIEETLEKAGIGKDDIDAIAVTRGPGLIPALLVGVSAAKTLALVWGKPLLGIHHLEGHIYANFIGNFQTNPNSRISNEDPALSVIPAKAGIQAPQTAELESTNDGSTDRKSEIENLESVFPLLALIVSGGHTQLVLMRDHFRYEIVGETRDDAAGEAFDKAARLLGLSYPGGPQIALRASNHDLRLKIDESANHESEIVNRGSSITLPRPMIDSPDLDFSFSGLKTAVLYLVKENESKKSDEAFVSEVAHEFQEAVVDVLVRKTAKAVEAYFPKTVIIAGGVSANERLRNRLRSAVEGRFPDTTFMMPEFKYSLDNAAMIGAAALYRYERLSDTERAALNANALTLEPNANLPLA